MFDEVDKQAFVRVDLPSFFRDDKTFLGKPCNGYCNQTTVRENGVAGKYGEGNPLLNRIPDGGEVGGVMKHTGLQFFSVKMSEYLTSQNKIAAEKNQREFGCFSQRNTGSSGQGMAFADAQADGPFGQFAQGKIGTSFGIVDKGQINFFPFHHIQSRAAGRLRNFQFDFRVKLMKFA